ncbi:class II aldolase/adducin family protein [Staphylococcus nepalensis]|uniref:Class II aldolase/adducin family protein n=1 Tax=Staphylococcus nepalensis TaxID=214473 RepID=A0ABS3L2L3_9STAP|nr:class II aldolase/adducin family protein [Staphylococcus nepalensis]MBO1206301.1 class II aldolase/adducin family protein [Staphylococcus nepalensis]MBO1212310.1 class II aldolase/adducin family protein [Staphylococcus nepalensis]MBO1217053.1 class II aldolase/adducin family protein [Staphylococcus nepalensis]MBO1227787.1 class II aldolase/adducin family protein [Staphylococcus nepalensis]MBO1235315.1 class II aldolase/adducin family protein [Staphylococcus nepalensis]
MDKKEKELREQICDIGKNLFNKDFIAANDGNISARLSGSEILATPTATSKGYLTPESIVKLDLDGNIIEAQEGVKPSSEVKMHLRCYKEMEECNGVVHAHPPYATGFAIKGEVLDKATMPEVVIAMPEIPLAEYGCPSTEEIPDSVEPYFGKYEAVLLESHGALTWGDTLMNAYFNMERLEYIAKLTFITRAIGGERELPKNRIDELVALRPQYGK